MTYLPLAFLLLAPPGASDSDSRMVVPYKVPLNGSAQALAYVSLAESKDEMTTGNAVYDICRLRNENSIEDVISLVGIAAEKGRGRTIGGRGYASMYPVVVFLDRTYPQTLPTAMYMLSSQDLNFAQKLPLLTYITHQEHNVTFPDIVQFMRKRSNEYLDNSRRCESLRKSLNVESNQQPVGESKFIVLPLTRAEEIKGWTVSHEEKVARAQKIFEVENAVDLAVQRNDLVSLTKALDELKETHFQMSSRLLTRFFGALPADTFFNSSAQSAKLRQSFAVAMKSIGPPANHALVEALVTYGKDVRLRSFLTSCLVGTTGSASQAGEVLQLAQVDYAERAERINALLPESAP